MRFLKTLFASALLGAALAASGCVGALQGGVLNLGDKPTYQSPVYVATPTGATVPNLKITARPDVGTPFDCPPSAPNFAYCVTQISGGAYADVSGDGFTPQTVRFVIGQAVHVTLAPAHFDPSTLSLNQLAAIRGSMWTARLDVPYGPRPNDPSNIIAFPFYDLYDAPTRARMVDAYKARGYTTTVTGPVTGNDCYHGLYPCRQGVPNQAEWDAYLDSLQEQWDNGLEPCYFAHPDGYWLPDDSAAMDQLDALYMQPRAQKLIRCVGYAGWEPNGTKYGWPNSQWVAWVQRGARVFPNAFRFIHMTSDLDAPTGGDDSATFPFGKGNAMSWQNVAPYVHAWFVQLGGYVEDNTPTPTPGFLQQFTAYWADLRNKFTNGASEWPTSSAWGPGIPLRVCYAEGAAYRDFWNNFPESVSQDLGDLAMQSGADCYLDGGRVPVPVR